MKAYTIYKVRKGRCEEACSLKDVASYRRCKVSESLCPVRYDCFISLLHFHVAELESFCLAVPCIVGRPSYSMLCGEGQISNFQPE